MLISFPNDGRKLKKLITGVLKAKLALEIKRMNYLQSYTLVENTVEKKEEKLLWIKTDQVEKVSAFLQKSFPEAVILSLN
ncbi:MAG: hypothetical protein LBD11_08880 [Candidatus Peribacteria bacterium]|jgi:uncharacterized protein involved in tolerance to divalent cations|nr:hypothetical protein [Candidatus Peribacteria bacterium]